MVAYPLQIRWKESDSSLFRMATATESVRTSPAGNETTTGTTLPPPAGGVNRTVVGLAVGCTAMAVILLVIVAIVVYRRRRRQQALSQGLHTGQGEAARPGIAEMPDPSLVKVLPLTTNLLSGFPRIADIGHLQLRIDIRSPLLRQKRRRFRLRLRSVPFGVNLRP